MLTFVKIKGDVLVDDRKKKYCQMAHRGMALDTGGDYLIATTSKSSAEVMIDRDRVTLGPSSYLHFGSGRAATGKHRQGWKGDAKLFMGRIWKSMGGDARYVPGPGGSGGIRG